MADKKIVTTTSKALVWVLGLSIAVNAVLILSGLKFNPLLLLAALLFVGALAFYFYRKPKALDFFDVIRQIRKRYHEYYGYWLDPTDAQAIPLTQEVSFFFFPLEAITFYFDVTKQRIYGLQISHLLNAVKRQEKSNLFASSQRWLGIEAQLRQQAELLGADVEKLGLGGVKDA